MTPLCLALFVEFATSQSVADQPRCLFVCDSQNDLFELLSGSSIETLRFDNIDQVLAASRTGDAILLLSDGYPDVTLDVSPSDLTRLSAQENRVYVEYPRFLMDRSDAVPIASSTERVVVASSFFGDDLPQLRILSMNGTHYLPADSPNPLLVAARVAGFDTAIYGLPKQTAPLLFKMEDSNVLVGTTKLSHVRSGRYAPQDAWQTVWSRVIAWLTQADSDVPLPRFEPVVRPRYASDEKLPEGAQRDAVARGVDWFDKSKMLIHPDWDHLVQQAAEQGRIPMFEHGLPSGDGSLGSLEGVLSIIQVDGRQSLSVAKRYDCTSETAMALAAGAKLLKRPELGQAAENLLDNYLFESEARKQERGDPQHPAYGLIAWGVTTPAWYKANYGDDNARGMLSTLAAAALLKQEKWDEPMALCLLANLRTTGKLGFRSDRIDMEPLEELGWEPFFQSELVSYHPHFEAYLWACYLWAYAQTDDKLLYERAATALRMTMREYPHGWRWTNGLAQERARILLPLAWLVRVEDTPENRQLLMQAVDGLLSLQDESGAIREELGALDKGDFPPPRSNEAYGESEASLIAQNGDPVADLLYTNNFAFLGLHEAAAVTGDPRIREAENRLADFLMRIQVQSHAVPEVDGGWFRAFDFNRWEPWGSNADLGWGAWCIESGWTQGWITFVLAMRELDTSLWDLTRHSKFGEVYRLHRPKMIPDKAVQRLARVTEIDHMAVGKQLIASPPADGRYPDESDLLDGKLATLKHTEKAWAGWQGDAPHFLIDLEEPSQIGRIKIAFLKSEQSGIYPPQKIDIAYSDDGREFRSVNESDLRPSKKGSRRV